MLSELLHLFFTKVKQNSCSVLCFDLLIISTNLSFPFIHANFPYLLFLCFRSLFDLTHGMMGLWGEAYSKDII